MDSRRGDDRDTDLTVCGNDVQSVPIGARSAEARGATVLIFDEDKGRKAEADPASTEARLAEVLDGMSEAFGLMDHDFRIITQNRAALALDGRSIEEIRGRSHWDVFPGTEDSELGRLYKRAFAEQAEVSLEHRYEFSDGAAKWLGMRAFPVPEGLAVFWRDITEQKEAEIALNESEARYRSLFDAIDEAVCFLVPHRKTQDGPRDYRYTAMNRAMQEMFGIADLSGQTVRDHFPNEAEAWYDDYDRVLDTGVPIRIERAAGPLGKVLSIFVTRVELGGKPCLLTVMQDITARRQAEDALRRSESHYRGIFEEMAEGFCVVEFRFREPDGRADYRVIDANPAFYEETGFPKSIRDRWLREAAPDLEEHWYETYGAVARTREPVRFEQKSDLLERWFEVHAFPIGEPEALRIAILFKNITERKQAESHQNILLAELDHRVKNILAVVQSIARQTLGRSGAAGPDAGDRLVGRIGALARSHVLLAQNRWQGAQFADIVESAVAPFGIGNESRIAVRGPRVNVSPKAAQTISLAVHELATNAAKHGALSREGGRVTAEWSLQGRREDLRLVFTWQEEGGPPISAPPARKGFGSKLTERTLAYELEGNVTLDFAREGLRAVVDLPVASIRAGKSGNRATKPAPSERPAERDLATLHGKRVLVVEDEYLVAEETCDALRSAGCEVLGPAGSLPNALQMAGAADLDGALLDINLDGELIWPAALALHARRIPIVFVSGYSEVIEPPSELRDAARIEKPIDRHALLSAIANSMSRSGGK